MRRLITPSVQQATFTGQPDRSQGDAAAGLLANPRASPRHSASNLRFNIFSYRRKMKFRSRDEEATPSVQEATFTDQPDRSQGDAAGLLANLLVSPWHSAPKFEIQHFFA